MIVLENIIYLICNFRDITEKQQAEKLLFESMQRFRALTEATSDLIWEVNTSGIYTYINPKI